MKHATESIFKPKLSSTNEYFQKQKTNQTNPITTTFTPMQEDILNLFSFETAASPSEDASTPCSLFNNNPFEQEMYSVGSSEDKYTFEGSHEPQPMLEQDELRFLSMDDILCCGEEDASYKSPNNNNYCSTSTAPFAFFPPPMPTTSQMETEMISQPTTIAVTTNPHHTVISNNKEAEEAKLEEEFKKMDANTQKKTFHQTKKRIGRLRIKNTQMMQEKESYIIKLASTEMMKQRITLLEQKKYELCIRFWRAVSKLQQK